MKKALTILAMLISFFSLPIMGQTFSSLWKQVEVAAEKDLPRTQLECLQKIITKATKEKAYGHLLKAEMGNVSVQSSISPDSLQPAFQRLVDKEAKVRTTNPVLAAVYQSVLAQTLRGNYRLSKLFPGRENDYFRLSMSHPEMLAKHKAAEFTPLFENGYDSRWFDDDLLSVIGYAARDYKTLHDYYVNTPLKTAACLTALEMIRSSKGYGHRMSTSEYVRQLDSLINVYGDLKVAGELGIARYQFMESAVDVNTEDRINYINYALNKWGAWPRMNILRNAQKELTRSGFNVDFGLQVSLPERSRQVYLSQVRNVQQITMTVNRVEVEADKEYDLSDDKVYAEVAKTKSRVHEISETRSFIGQPEYAISKDTIDLPGLAPGIYLVEFTPDKNDVKPCRFFYYVSDVFVISQMLPEHSTRYVAVSATTGQPLPGATIVLKSNDRRATNPTKTITTDNQGEAVFPVQPKNIDYKTVFAYTTRDRFSPPQWMWSNFYYTSYDDMDRTNTQLFTDRKIYRPGQQVHVSALVHTNKGGMDLGVGSDKELTFTLYDANHRSVEVKSADTDEFGVAAVDFTLPKNGLTGNFVIRADNGSVNFRVEEYKRPTFQIEFPEVNEHYEAGDTVVVTAHAMTYAGVPVQGAKVTYKVSRNNSYWWWRDSSGGEELITKETTTDQEGAFLLEMPMILPQWVLESKSPHFYDIVAEVMVTDMGGESHEGEFRLPIGNRSTAFACDLPEQSLRDSLKTITFTYKNAAGNDIEGSVRYWIDGHMTPFTAKANQPVDINWPKPLLASGKHHIKAICEKDTLEQDFVFFSLADTKPCVETHDWFYTTAQQFADEHDVVTIQVGSSDRNVHAVYMIASGGQLIEKGQMAFDNSIVTKKFKYSEEYAKGVLFSVAWVKEGKMYEHTVDISRPQPDKRLEMEWVTFRDRLTPGQSEEWKLRIHYPDGTPARAQLMATLYDQSLDQIIPHHWDFSPSLFLPKQSAEWSGYTFHSIYKSTEEPFRRLKEASLAYTHFDESLFATYSPFFNGSMRMMKSARVSAVSAIVVEESVDLDSAPMAFEAANAAGDEASTSTTSESPKKGGEAQVRENLNETAFFLPQVTTDKDGVATLSFTLPESITTWQFMGLAHDTQLNHGIIKAQTVARKEVMVQPNVPRFVRTGDRAQISSRIFNTTAKSISGVAKLELIDPATDKVVVAKNKNYTIGANGSDAIVFEVETQDLPALLICRVTASGKGYSDGEQHYLPVLPNTEWVTNTLPLTMHGPTTEQVDLHKLFPQGTTHQTLTVEYTGNPAWLVLQALPTLAADEEHNAISQAASIYANTIGSFILDQVPHAKEVFEQWMKEAGEETTMMSQLSKNQDVKNIVLNETPWVAAADHETAQRQALSTFFDEQVMQRRSEAALAKLAQLQNADGSWSWWPGMEGSAYMTQAVAEMMVRLNVLTSKQNSTSAMLTKAIDYLGKELVEEQKELKEAEKKGAKDLLPTEWAINVLYTFALDKREQPKDVQQAIDYMVSLLKKQPKGFTIYGKAHTAVILAHNGQTKTAREFMQSLREYTVYTEQNGRYYDTPKAYYSWCNYLIPTQVAAIEALEMLEPQDTQTVDDMLRWLLMQKRTEMWNTNINTTNAVYAFLNGRTKQLEAPNVVDITVDGRPVPVDQATAGIGFIKSQMEADQLDNLTIRKQDDHTSWGAVYAQFSQKSTEVEGHTAGLQVTREVVGGTQVSVGDKVTVRITIVADRDYDFVQVTDQRAACMEPVRQLSGYANGYYCTPKDNCTNYYFSRMRKGTHVVETEYYIDRAGDYTAGSCSVQCAYAPEYSARTRAYEISSK